MQDLRGAPPVSKTTIVVVLVVFGLVIVVGVFGLLAFSSYEDLRRNDMREAAVREARGELDDIQRQLNRTMDGLLARVGRVDGPDALRKILASPGHGPLVREIFRFEAVDDDPVGDIRWVDSDYLLYTSPERIEAYADFQARRVDMREKHFEEIEQRKPAEGAAAVLPLWHQVASGWGLEARKTATDSLRQSNGITYAIALLETAWEVADSNPDRVSPATMRAVVMRAVEIETLWEGRKNIKELPRRLATLRSEIRKLLDRLPDDMRTDIEWEVRRYRRYHGYIADTVRRTRLEVAVSTIRDPDRPARYLIHSDPELLGIVRIGAGTTLIARLNEEAVYQHAVRALIDTNRFRDLGMEADAFRWATAPRFSDQDPTGELSLNELPFELPFRLAFLQTGDPKALRGGWTDLLFWVVIGLAAAGLVVGGYVLIRLLTREIRIAQLKADFVSNLSHELKTPITSISLFTEMLDAGSITDADEQAEAFSVLHDEAQRLQRIVMRMINVARGEARENPFELEPGDLNQVVMEVATRFRRITTEPGLDLVLALFPEPLPIRMDVQAMDDAVTNLLSNAWKYKRGDQVRITVRTARRGRHAELLVSDDGVGIPREDRRRVFEMFYRANQYLTHPVAGTGLGLALVRNVVRGHKGTVRVEAGEGGTGAAFRLRFPLDLMGVAAEEQAAHPQTPAQEPPRPEARGTLDGDPAEGGVPG